MTKPEKRPRRQLALTVKDGSTMVFYGDHWADEFEVDVAYADEECARTYLLNAEDLAECLRFGSHLRRKRIR